MKRIARTLGIAALSIGLAAAGHAAGFDDLAANLWGTTLAAMRLQRQRVPFPMKEGPSPADRVVDITITGDFFAPAVVTIAKGDWIRWINNDDEAHTATGKGFDTGRILVGKSGRVRFKKTGTFPYHCIYHAMMTGRIVVK